MDPEILQKISDTVIAILKEADMEEMTEFKVRKQASENLGMDLSEPEFKRFVRHVVETYLVEQHSMAEAEHSGEPENTVKEEVEEQEEEKEEEEEEEEKYQKRKLPAKEYDDGGDLIICTLSNKRKVTLQDFRGKTLVSIREYYTKDGKELPSSKGISLSTEQWSNFSKNLPEIDKAIKKMESKLM